MNFTGDICSTFRPKKFSEVVGQKAIVASLKAAVLNKNRSSLYLLHGTNGIGKTTLARILAACFNCDNLGEDGNPCGICLGCMGVYSQTNLDIVEIDAADANGINEVRGIKTNLSNRSLYGRTKVVIFDEVHGMSVQGQKALLKMAEETPGNSVLIMCTTDPTKLDKGLIDRAECYALSTLSPTEISSYVSYICTLMGMPLDEKVIELVTEQSQGKPRRALKGLQKAINIGFDHIDDIKEVLALDEEVDKDVLDLYRSIISGYSSWDKIMSTYRAIEMDSEMFRIMLAGLFRSLVERSKNLDRRALESLGILLKPLPYPKPENALVYCLASIFSEYKR